MSLIAIDGFDHQNSQTDLIANFGPFAWRGVSNVTPSADGSGLGGTGKSLQLSSGGHMEGVYTNPLSSGFVGIQVYAPAAPEFDVWFWNSVTQSGPDRPQIQVYVRLMTANGQIQIWRGEASQGGAALIGQTGNNFFPNNAAFELEVGITIAPGTGGRVEVRVNTVSYAVSGVNTSMDGNSVFDSIRLGGANFYSNSGGIIDHFYTCDTATGPGTNPFNTFQGICQVYTLFGASAGASTGWTPNAGTNVSQIQEHAMDSDTTFNSTQTVNALDLFNVSPLPTTAAPLAVQVTGCFRQDTGGTRVVQNVLTSGSTTFNGSTEVANTGYAYQRDVLPQDPNGNIAWTRANVNATQIGYRLVS